MAGNHANADLHCHPLDAVSDSQLTQLEVDLRTPSSLGGWASSVRSSFATSYADACYEYDPSSDRPPPSARFTPIRRAGLGIPAVPVRECG